MNLSIKTAIRGYLRDIWWVLYGRSVTNPSLPELPTSLMFVCKGNICRSPFAEHEARRQLLGMGLGCVSANSAGLEVSKPEKSPTEAIAAARTFNIDLRRHKSQELDGIRANESEMIVAMEVSHIRLLKKRYPELQRKFFLLPLFEKNCIKGGGYRTYNIPDPYDKSEDVFRECYTRITLALEQMLLAVYSSDIGQK